MIDLDTLVRLFTEYDYLSVFLVLLLCGVGLPVPEDIVLLAGGVISELGYANVHVMFGVCMAGVLLGDWAMFMMGRHFGERVMTWRWVACLITPRRRLQVQQKFDRYGNRLLLIARFLPGLRAPIFIVAGWSRRVSPLKFILLDGIAALVSVPFWVYLGDYGADNREWLLAWAERGKTGIWCAIVVVVLVFLLMIWRRLRQR
ncbi:MAG: DedA family protein [Stenotrophobium sp.]